MSNMSIQRSTNKKNARTEADMKNRRIAIRKLEMEREHSAIHLLATKFGKPRLTFRF